jgi:hypothetical protein
MNQKRAMAKNDFHRLDNQVVLYKLPYEGESDEYRAGAYYVYNIDTGESNILLKSIMVDYANAWVTTNNQYVVLESYSITLLDNTCTLLVEEKIDNSQLIIGGIYSKKYNKVFFLMATGDPSMYIIGLYQYDIAGRSIKEVIDKVSIQYENIEEPFKDIFFISDDKLLIRNYSAQFLEIDLISKRSQEVIIDSRKRVRLVRISQNKSGLIYLKDAGYDNLGMHYKLMQYDFKEQLSRELINDIVNIEWESKSVELVSNCECDSFFLQVGSKVYLYDQDVLQELPIKSAESLSYYKGMLLYKHYSSEIKAYSVNKTKLKYS